jgi:cytidylate kinase
MESKNRVIAIDGPAASGKSSVSTIVSEKTGFLHINSGLMYRALTWSALNSGVDPSDAVSIIDHLNLIDMNCRKSGDSLILMINGNDLGDELKSEQVNSSVSIVSAIKEVRDELVKRQRDYVQISNIVMEGRDIGSVVFPDTPFKFYIDASPEVRAKRRQGEGGQDDLLVRDKLDASRKVSPLVIPKDSFFIDTSHMKLNEVVDKVMAELILRGLDK